MSYSPYPLFTRRGALTAALGLAASPALAARRKVVTILGDSITAGLGLPAAEALPARLQAELAKLGSPAEVRGAGVSGDTTQAGLSRLDFSVQSDTDVCLVALGGNDLLRGVDPKATKRNLEAIVRRLKARRIRVVMTGLKAPQAIGRGYARDYDAVFPAVAKETGVGFYPDLRKGVVGNPRLNQPDNIHPNAQGVVIVARGLAPLIVRALKAPAAK